MKLACVARYGIAAAVAMAGLYGSLAAANAAEDQIDAMRKALEKYKDPYVAIRDLYLSTEACVYFDGTKIEGGMDYPKGAMGVHFVNLTIQGPPDPMKPNVLTYEPEKGGKLKLVGAEWLVPLAAAKGRPTLLDQKFQGPMEGHEPLIPKEFQHYDLHAWLFKDNPLGMFTATSSSVSCQHSDHKLLEMPPMLVPEK